MVSPEMLRRFSCFSPIQEESLKALATIASEEMVPAGRCLFSEGEPAGCLSLLIDGEVDIQYRLANGELRTIDTLIAGDLLGWSALVPPYKMTGIATTNKASRLIRIQAQPLRDICERDPALGYRLVTQVARLLADRLDGTRVQLALVN